MSVRKIEQPSDRPTNRPNIAIERTQEQFVFPLHFHFSFHIFFLVSTSIRLFFCFHSVSHIQFFSLSIWNRNMSGSVNFLIVAYNMVDLVRFSWIIPLTVQQSLIKNRFRAFTKMHLLWAHFINITMNREWLAYIFVPWLEKWRHRERKKFTIILYDVCIYIYICRKKEWKRKVYFSFYHRLCVYVYSVQCVCA